MPLSFARLSTGFMFCVIATSAVSQQQDQNIVHRHTLADKEVLIRAHAEWNGSCVALAPPRIDVTEAPAHGHIDLRPGDAPLGSNYVGGTNCEGRVGPGIQVIYVPDGAFHGSDVFTYEVQYHRGTARTIQAKISVE